MAYVTYLFPEHAVRAKAEMHGKVSFVGFGAFTVELTF